MKWWIESLRGQLVLAMLFVFAAGTGLAYLLSDWETTHQVLLPPDSLMLREPYQDLSVVLPIGLIGVALIWVVGKWSLRDVHRVADEAARVGGANTNARISDGRLPMELRPMVSAINGALDRMAEVYETERRFVADFAHQMRTPLTVLNLRLQRAKLDGSVQWPEVERDLADLNRLVDQLLDLARKEQARIAQPDAVALDLARVAREAAAAMAPIVDRDGRRFDVDLAVSLPVVGRAHDLRDMIRNLLENAVVHGRGAISITSARSRDAAGRPIARLRIGDEGGPPPTSFAARAFERFSKADASSPGNGLGLSIVREVVAGHAGTVAFADGPHCAIVVDIPLDLRGIERRGVTRAVSQRAGRRIDTGKRLSSDTP